MSAAIELEGRARRAGPLQALSLPMALGLVLVGVFAFAAIVLLTSYSDELGSDDPAIATANDRGAVGYAGLQVLLDELGYEVRVDPYPQRGAWNGRDLRLYFPTAAFSESRLERIDTDAPGLVVLPKWRVFPVAPGSTDVVRRSDPGLSYAARRILSVLDEGLSLKQYNSVQTRWEVDGLGTLEISRPRWIEADGRDADGESDDAAQDALDAIILTILAQTDGAGSPPPDGLDALLHPVDGLSLLVLAEPDLLSNHGIATEPSARIALQLLEAASRRFEIDDPVFVFDDNLRRRDVEQNLVKLLTRPPFLAATLCLLAAGALVGWQGFNRFGEAVRDGEDAPDAASRGPRALAESAAGFILGAGRLDALSPGYAEVVKRQAVEALGLSVWDRARAEAALRSREELRDITPRFAAIRADRTLSPMNRARALLRWKEEIIR